MSAEYNVVGQVAVITFNNPPVNGLGLATRQAVVAGVERALADASVKAIVLTGAGKAFSGGADIKEFNTPAALAEPNLHSMIAMVEASSKPVIAAMHTICMGGGLELALGCNYRIATASTQMALPEVKIGLLPGAGGTQRLPRVVGLELALDMIVTGKPVAAEKLAHTALFDEVIAADADLIAAALALANQVAGVLPLPRVRDRNVDYPGHAAYLEAARAAVVAKAGAYPAPPLCVDAVAAAVNLPFEAGLKFELALFMQLIQTTESKALRHAFFGERLASKVADLPADTPTRAIRQAAVVGAGTMGAGISMAFANAGIPVLLLDATEAALARAEAAIRANYAATVKKGKLSEEKAQQRLELITTTLAYADISMADIVVEAVFEDMDAKQAVFEELDAVMKVGAILASNTSTLNLNHLANFTRRPQDVIGTHFFSPANVMKLLEIVRGAKTSHEVLASVLALSKRLGKTGVVAGVCDGFIGNRMVEQYTRQAAFLLDEGCFPAQVDQAAERFGFAMGPFRMSDLAGNDIGWAIRKRRYVEKAHMTYSTLPDALCTLGRFGQKVGAGWYDYAAGERQARPSALVDEMVVAHSATLGLVRRQIGEREIVDRLVYALVNEAALLLEEGIAQRASDIDMVCLTGYGFPLFRGGPMFYADTVGLERVLETIQGFAAGYHGEAWKPAPLLGRLAAGGKTFTGAQ